METLKMVKINKIDLGQEKEWFEVSTNIVEGIIQRKATKYYDNNLTLEENLEENGLVEMIVYNELLKIGFEPIDMEMKELYEGYLELRKVA